MKSTTTVLLKSFINKNSASCSTILKDSLMYCTQPISHLSLTKHSALALINIYEWHMYGLNMKVISGRNKKKIKMKTMMPKLML